MTFNEKMSSLSEKIPSLIDHLETEEATKNALVMPFIASLGYDVFNPKEVVPEFIADHGTKKGEKVDYAIMQNNEVIILIECKKAKSNLNETNMSQLYRYFTVTKSRIAILTNGINYLFFSDLEEPNKMDKKPFLELDLLNLRKNLLAEVKKLGKEKFDLDRMLSTANELNYCNKIQLDLTFSRFPASDSINLSGNEGNPARGRNPGRIRSISVIMALFSSICGCPIDAKSSTRFSFPSRRICM